MSYKIPNADIQIFQGNAAPQTWTQPPGAKMVFVYGSAGGGAGAPGQVIAAGGTVVGAPGGGGGGAMFMSYPAAMLGATESVLVGLGGIPGGSIGSNDGQNTAFGNWNLCRGGVAGDAGANPGTGGFGWPSDNVGIASVLYNGGNTAIGLAPTRTAFGGGGGAAGGGINAGVGAGGFVGGATGDTGIANRGSLYTGLNQLLTGGATGATPGNGKTRGATAYMGGSGGGGATSVVTANGKAGGIGGFPGGGGGGGASTLTGFTAGLGGAGGAGILIVVTIF